MRINCLLSLLAFSAQPSYAQTDFQPKMYQQKAGYVRSTISIGFSKENTSTVSEIFVWDDWGMKIAKYQTDNKTGRSTKTVIRLTIKQGQSDQIVVEDAALVELPSGEYKSIPYPALKVMNSFTREEKQDMATNFILAFGLFSETDEKRSIAGQSCRIWRAKTNNNHTNCLWHGIIIETYMVTDAFSSVKEAIQVKIQEVDSKHFEIPGWLKPYEFEW